MHRLLEKLTINAKHLASTCLQRQLSDSGSRVTCFHAMVKQKLHRNSLFVSARSVREMPQLRKMFNQYEVSLS